MKVVVQNGCEHVLSRNDVENAIKNIPSKYFGSVSQITLCQSDNEDYYVRYYEKSKALSLFCARDTDASKVDVLNELLIALACIYDIDEYPLKITKNRRDYYLNEMLE